MRMLLFILIMFFYNNLYSQGIPLDKFTIDTIHLKNVTFRKVLCYKTQSVTFYFKFEDCENAISALCKIYNSSSSNKVNAGYINPDFEPRRRILDSALNLLKSGVKRSDTVYLAQSIFDPYLIAPFQKIIPHEIETGDCSIFDENNNQYFIIIRHTGYWYRDTLAAWGGRRYFLPGRKEYFMAATDRSS
jgi:hypothetical protein